MDFYRYIDINIKFFFMKWPIVNISSFILLFFQFMLQTF